MKFYLDEYEELVLLTIASLDTNAYGVSVKEFIEERTGRPLSMGTLYSATTRLEDKGFLTSYMGEPTAERGGRRKRFYEVTKNGKAALNEMKAFRDALWTSAKPYIIPAK